MGGEKSGLVSDVEFLADFATEWAAEHAHEEPVRAKALRASVEAVEDAIERGEIF
jgi:hypothetical protein